MLHATDLLYSLSGLAIGVLVGMTGVGGGSLMTPLLVLLFGFHPATAVGTDLLYAAVTKVAGTTVHGVCRSIDWRIVGLLAAGSLPATGIGLLVLAHLGDNGVAVGRFIGAALAVALFLTAAALIFRETLLAKFRDRIAEPSGPLTVLLTTATGFGLGLLVSLSSVGAGAIGVIALTLLYPRMAALKIVGTDIAHAVPLTLFAGLGHWMLGTVDWQLFWSLLAGSVPGVIIGSLLAKHAPEKLLRFSLAGILAIVASRFALA